MKRLLLPLVALVALCGCAPVAREPDDLALVRVLGVDGAGPMTLTAVCGSDGQQEVRRGSAAGPDFGAVRKQLPWSGKGEELSLTGVSYLLVGPDADLMAVLFAILEDADLGASASVWLAEGGAEAVLSACNDPAADLELLALQGIPAPTVAQTVAALCTDGAVTLPCLGAQDGRLEKRGMEIWTAEK